MKNKTLNRQKNVVRCDILVIGLGPAGIMATKKLHQRRFDVIGIDKGKSFEERDKSNPTDVANGFGGAGLFSDGKLSFYPSASKLWNNIPKEQLKLSYNILERDLAELGCMVPKWSDDWTTAYIGNGTYVKEYSSIFIKDDIIEKFLSTTYRLIQNRIILGTEAIKINSTEENKFIVHTDNIKTPMIECARIIFATGKHGNGLFSTTFTEKYGIKMKPRFEGGVRLETDFANFKPSHLKQLDYKYIEQLDTIGEFRTFCCCKEGVVIESDYGECVSYNGSISAKETGRSNIGLTLRTENENHPFEKELNEWYKNRKKFVISYHDQLKSVPKLIGDVFDAVFYKHIDLIIFSRRIDYTTLIYGPEIEYFGYYPVFCSSSLKIPNIRCWIIGDLTAEFRGLTAAMVSGIFVAESISRRYA